MNSNSDFFTNYECIDSKDLKLETLQYPKFILVCFNIFPTHLNMIFWRGKSKLPNEHPLEHREAIGNHRAPSLFSSTAWFDCVSSVCCNSACCGSSSSTSNSTFPGLGFESHSRQFFRLFFSSPNFLRRSINGEYFLITLSIDWYELSLESHYKKLPWLGFEPQT